MEDLVAAMSEHEFTKCTGVLEQNRLYKSSSRADGVGRKSRDTTISGIDATFPGMVWVVIGNTVA